MSINMDVLEAYENAEKPLKRAEVAERLGLTLIQAGNAISWLLDKGKITHAPGANPAKQNQPYVIVKQYAKAGPEQINRLTLPPYVPPKLMHRPFVDAPGCVVRRLLTGEVMT